MALAVLFSAALVLLAIGAGLTFAMQESISTIPARHTSGLLHIAYTAAAPSKPTSEPLASPKMELQVCLLLEAKRHEEISRKLGRAAAVASRSLNPGSVLHATDLGVSKMILIDSSSFLPPEESGSKKAVDSVCYKRLQAVTGFEVFQSRIASSWDQRVADARLYDSDKDSNFVKLHTAKDLQSGSDEHYRAARWYFDKYRELEKTPPAPTAPPHKRAS